MAQETQTPEAVIAAATRPAEGNLKDLVLLGTFGAESDPQAMIRTSRGKIVTLKVGDRIGRDHVIAIGEGRLVLVHNGKSRWLRQPVAQ